MTKKEGPTIFRERISNHPKYNPYKTSFIYTDSPQQDISDEEIANFFRGENPPSPGQVLEVTKTLQDVVYEVEMYQDGYMFLPLRYHPLLSIEKYVNGQVSRNLFPEFAQAGTMAIQLSKGKHTLRIYYPEYWYDWFGKLFNILGLLWGLVWFVRKD